MGPVKKSPPQPSAQPKQEQKEPVRAPEVETQLFLSMMKWSLPRIPKSKL